MASSSVSQESLDREDYEISTRRSRIRTLRSRTTAAHNKNESVETTDDKDQDGEDMLDADLSLGPSPGHVTFAPPGAGAAAGDHESPTRLTARMKDKRIRPNHMHLHKGKTAKDKRKLREKRRSTGVVHLQSTEVWGNTEVRSASQWTWLIVTHHSKCIKGDFYICAVL